MPSDTIESIRVTVIPDRQIGSKLKFAHPDKHRAPLRRFVNLRARFESLL